MKIRFQDLRDPNSFPLPKPTVFEGKELDEIHVRMKKHILTVEGIRRDDTTLFSVFFSAFEGRL